MKVFCFTQYTRVRKNMVSKIFTQIRVNILASDVLQLVLQYVRK